MSHESQNFRLSCQVKSFVREIREEHASYSSIIVCLVPEPSNQRDLFYSKWLEDAETVNLELPGKIQHPVSPFVRLALRSGDDKNSADGHFTGPYLFVMSRGVAKWLHKNKQNKRIDVVILSEDDEEQLDLAVDDAEGNYTV